MEAPDHGGSAAPQHCDESAFHRTDSSGRLLALLLVFAAPAFQLRDLHLPVVPNAWCEVVRTGRGISSRAQLCCEIHTRLVLQEVDENEAGPRLIACPCCCPWMPLLSTRSGCQLVHLSITSPGASGLLDPSSPSSVGLAVQPSSFRPARPASTSSTFSLVPSRPPKISKSWKLKFHSERPLP